jgi:hypothetical protein
MKRAPITIALLLTSMLSCLAQKAPVVLPGCPNPDDMSKALKEIGSRDWNEISETTLSSMWPTEVSPIDCNAGACQTLGRNERIINNECECCELFHFKIERDSDGRLIKEQMKDVIINYAATNKDEILSAAKQFARALGLPDTDAATIGREPRKQFDWKIGSGHNEIALMTVQVTHQQKMWNLYLFFGHEPL